MKSRPIKILTNIPAPIRGLGKAAKSSKSRNFKPIQQITPSGMPTIDTSVSKLTLAINKGYKFIRKIAASLF